MSWQKSIFSPQSVALVGASSGVGKMGRVFMENLLSGYGGQVYPVHPKEKSILGCPAYANLTELPERPDLAVIVSPPNSVLSVVEDCAKTGIQAAVVITSGFAETGATGRIVQDRIKALASEAGLRLVGPNCFGVVNVHQKLNASLSLALPRAGGISLYTQSGAYGMLCISRFENRAMGFAKIFAAGNKLDLDEVDLLSCFGEDPDTKVIAMLLESIVDLDAFAEAAQRVAKIKPVVILENGRSPAARRAAEHHTASFAHQGDLAAALAGSDVVLTKDGGTLLDAAATLSCCARQPALNVAIVTNSGGTGVELTDLLQDQGFEVPLLSPLLQDRLQQVIPAFGSPKNPVDMTPDAPNYPEMYGGILGHLLASDEVDIVIVVLLQRSATSAEVARRILSEVAQAQSPKPIHVCWDANSGAEGNRLMLEQQGIACHAWTRATVEAVKLCHQ